MTIKLKHLLYFIFLVLVSCNESKLSKKIIIDDYSEKILIETRKSVVSNENLICEDLKISIDTIFKVSSFTFFENEINGNKKVIELLRNKKDNKIINFYAIENIRKKQDSVIVKYKKAKNTDSLYCAFYNLIGCSKNDSIHDKWSNVLDSNFKILKTYEYTIFNNYNPKWNDDIEEDIPITERVKMLENDK